MLKFISARGLSSALLITLVAFTAFCAGLVFEGDDGRADAGRQISRLRGGQVDIYTKEALRKEFAVANLPR